MSSRVVYEGAWRAARRGLVERLGAGALEAEGVRTRRAHELDTVERPLEGRRTALRWCPIRSGGRLTWAPPGERVLELPSGSPPGFAWELEPGPLREALADAVGPRRLLPLREVEEREELVRRLDERGKTVVRLLVLRRRFRSPAGEGAWSAPEELLVVEPVRGYAAERDALVRLMDEVAVLERVPEGRLDARPAPRLPFPFEPPRSWPSVDRGEPAARALRRIVLRQLEVAEAQMEGLRADLDSEFCHDLRVAVRRTRALLAQLKRALAPGEIEGLRAELAWLGRETGPLRDLDVLAIELRTLDPELADGLEPLVELIEQRRREAHARVLEVLDSERWRDLRSAWRRWGQGAAPATESLFGVLVADRVARLYRRIRREGARLGPDAPADDLHALRIDCKKLRYLLECAREAAAIEEQRRCVRALKGLQQVLGDFNDAQLQAGELEALAGALAEREPLALLPLGRLVEHRRDGERAARAGFSERFEAFAARRSRRDFERLEAVLRGGEALAR